MPSLFMSLNTAYTALQADQAEIETIGHNVSNANTPGYSQQTVTLTASPAYAVPSLFRPMGAGQYGTGVTVSAVTRSRDPLLDAQFRYQSQLAGQWSTLDTNYGQLQGILPEPSTSALGSQITAFWNSWQSLANDPTNMGARAALQQSGVSLAATFNSDAQQVTQIQTVADAAATSAVTTINNAATQVANLNGQIRTVLAIGQQPNDLLDQRDLLLDQLANATPIITTQQADGTVTVQLATQVPGTTALQVANPNAAPLVSATTTNLLVANSGFQPTYTSTAAATDVMTTSGTFTGTAAAQYAVKVTSVSAGAPTGVAYSTNGGATWTASASGGSPFTLDGLGVTVSFSGTASVGDEFSYVAQPGSAAGTVTGAPYLNPNTLTPANAVTAPTGGQLGAALQVRDSVTGGPNGLLAQLTSLAQQLAKDVNTIHATGATLNGTAATSIAGDPTGAFFVASSGATITAANLAVAAPIVSNAQNIAAAAGPPATFAAGDGSLAQAIANARTTPGATGDPIPTITIQQAYENLVSGLGASAQQAKNGSSNQTLVMNSLTNQRQSVSGVSTDEQMTYLVQFQNSYAAAARIVTAVDSMLDTTINHMGLGN